MGKDTRLFYRSGFMLLGIATLIMIALLLQPVVGQSRSQTMYGYLQGAAAQGDKWAIGKLNEVNAMQQVQGQSGPPQEREVGARDIVNGISVAVEGREPFYLEIDNLPQLTSLGAIDKYIANRKPSLAQLSKRNLSRKIEVSISPQQHMPVTQVWELRDSYKLDIDQMLVDLFIDGKWHSVMFVGDPNDPDEVPYVDFTAPADKFEAQVKQLIPAQTPDKTVLDSPKLELKISWLRANIQAADALDVSSNPAIMLVDPITDILDAYQGRAVEVTVQNVPHLLVEKSRLEETIYQKSAPQSAPDTTQPTPSPVRR